MTVNECLYSDFIILITGQIILMTLLCEILSAIWHDENAKLGTFIGELSLCGNIYVTDITDMGPVMMGLIYTMIINFVIKLIIMVAHLPATVRHHKLVNRCKRVCKQNQWPTMADDICRICQTYCRQVRQKNLHP